MCEIQYWLGSVLKISSFYNQLLSQVSWHYSLTSTHVLEWSHAILSLDLLTEYQRTLKSPS